ncbi:MULTISPECIES: hypothetical protein [Prochlorococcus]|nr:MULTISPECIES: hypothetical protein [Prochlorococcus]KGG33607.1 hypothetical protein EV10_0447 [Prochlorococcus marinus str. SS51]KGG13411.1 hypothetical protein EV04_0646 [Prochlorococcus marinus str. LG]KGG21345.1 hypothetical protein EV08_0753 [Prochlorococcus marinus str. SS2]KGG24323.1 hypothetical protein EV09_0370 [Prochlorococcus marinus str. SS35]KGG36477.1 hypothetical protein EV11_0849 [Prochlorococcus sp. SS52]
MLDPKLRLMTLVIVNVLILIGLRYWILHSDVFIPLLNGLAS